jgi:hypothetical protein
VLAAYSSGAATIRRIFRNLPFSESSFSTIPSPVVVRKPAPARHLTLQYDQLMSENRILCPKSALQLEWRGQNGQNEAEQSEHGPQT